MKELLFAALLGLGGGGVYAMLGTGIVTAYKGSGVINFAHGAFAMYAAFVYDELLTNGRLALPWVDILPTDGLNLPVRITIRGWDQRVARRRARPAHGRGHRAARPPARVPAAAQRAGARQGHRLGRPDALPAGRRPAQLRQRRPGARGLRAQGADLQLPRLGENMPRLNLYLAGAAVIMGVAVWALLRFSRFGLATRAADENEKGASLLGYSPQRLAGLNWVLSAAAGRHRRSCSSSGAARSTRPATPQLVIPALGAALLGGLTSIPLADDRRSRPRHVPGRRWSSSPSAAGGRRGCRRPVSASSIPLVVIVGYLFLRGDRLPVRGTVVQRRLPRAPEPRHVLVGAVIPAALALVLSLHLHRATGRSR